jgi:hypothetical protein
MNEEQHKRRGQWLRAPLNEGTTKTRNHLLIIAALTICYVKLGMQPTVILGFKLENIKAPEVIGSILCLLVLYFLYLFTAQFLNAWCELRGNG